MKMYAPLIVAAGLLLAADQANKTNASLDGTWRVTQALEKGENPPADFLQKVSMTIKGNKLIFKDDQMSHEATFKLDASKKPMQIDMMPGDGPRKGQTLQGIYKLEGKTLTMCFCDKGAKRPTTFVSDKENNKNFLIVLTKK